VLASHFGKELLLVRAAELEASLDFAVFAQMMRTISRFSDQEIPINQTLVQDLRSFFDAWAQELDPVNLR
jgi:hypothetical protein